MMTYVRGELRPSSGRAQAELGASSGRARGELRPSSGCFLRTQLSFLTNVPSSPHTSSAITRRLCGWLGASVTQDLRALRLWQSSRQWRTQSWSCMDAAPGCRLQRRSSAKQHVDCVTRSGISPGTETQVARALLGPAHHVGARRRERNRTVRGPATELDDEANSQIADGYRTPRVRARGAGSVSSFCIRA